jgi:hypothetical protein
MRHVARNFRVACRFDVSLWFVSRKHPCDVPQMPPLCGRLLGRFREMGRGTVWRRHGIRNVPRDGAWLCRPLYCVVCISHVVCIPVNPSEVWWHETSWQTRVLAPAGNLRGLKTAVDYGADAVYCGGKAFGMRSAPKNLSLDDFARAPRYAHERGARVYVTLNVLPRNNEVTAIERNTSKQAAHHRCGRADRHRHRRHDARA